MYIKFIICRYLTPVQFNKLPFLLKRMKLGGSRIRMAIGSDSGPDVEHFLSKNLIDPQLTPYFGSGVHKCLVYIVNIGRILQGIGYKSNNSRRLPLKRLTRVRVRVVGQ